MKYYLVFLLGSLLPHLQVYGCTTKVVNISWDRVSSSSKIPKTAPGKATYQCRTPNRHKHAQRDLFERHILEALQGGALERIPEDQDTHEQQEESSLLSARQAKPPWHRYGVCGKKDKGKKPVQSTRVQVELDGDPVDVTTPHGTHIQLLLDRTRYEEVGGRSHTAMHFEARNFGNCSVRVEFATPVTYYPLRRGDPEVGPGPRDLPRRENPGDEPAGCMIDNLAITAQVFTIVIILLGFGC